MKKKILIEKLNNAIEKHVRYENELTRRDKLIENLENQLKSSKGLTIIYKDHVVAENNSCIMANDGVNVIAKDGSRVYALRGSTIEGKNGSEIIANAGVILHCESGAKVTLKALNDNDIHEKIIKNGDHFVEVNKKVNNT